MSVRGTIAVAGLWELGWNTPIKEIDLWEHPLKDFGVTTFYMTPVTGIFNPYVQERHGMEDILRENAHLTFVFVDERGTEDLTTFEHPEHALYIFGRSSTSAMAAWGREGDRSLVIPTVQNSGTLWPHQAAAIVLYDRMLKG
jgi:hypothetical protein